MVGAFTESEFYGGDMSNFTLLAPLVSPSKTSTFDFHLQVRVVTREAKIIGPFLEHAIAMSVYSCILASKGDIIGRVIA